MDIHRKSCREQRPLMRSTLERAGVCFDPAATVRRCAKEGCKVPLVGAPSPHELIDLDHPSCGLHDSTHCDFILIAAESTHVQNWVVPIEIKRGSPSASEVSKQLQAAADYVQRQLNAENSPKFVPVLCHGGQLKRSELKRFRATKIEFQNASYGIKRIRCGTPLVKALF